jgi:gluconate 5-dehydrogenase
MPVIDEFDLHHRVALVAGNAGGYLPELSTILAEAGAQVMVMSSSSRTVNDALRSMRHWDPDASGVVVDTTSQQEIDQAVTDLVSQKGPIAISVNSFRTEHSKPILEVTPDEWRESIRSNLDPVFLLCRAVGSVMVKQVYGRIVNITSVLAERGMVDASAFCAAQGAVLQLTRTLALEWGRQNVRVNAIGLGWFNEQNILPEEEQKEQLVRYIPLRRKGNPQDIGPLLVYLTSESCDYTTGQPVYIDGGLMARA